MFSHKDKTIDDMDDNVCCGQDHSRGVQCRRRAQLPYLARSHFLHLQNETSASTLAGGRDTRKGMENDQCEALCPARSGH